MHYIVGNKAHPGTKDSLMDSKMAEAVSVVQGEPPRMLSGRPSLRAGQGFPLQSSPELQRLLPGTLGSSSFFDEALSHAEHGSPSIPAVLPQPAQGCDAEWMPGRVCSGAAMLEGAGLVSEHREAVIHQWLRTRGLSDSVLLQPRLPPP